MNTKCAPQLPDGSASNNAENIQILSKHLPGNENDLKTKNKVHLIRIHKKPLAEDDGGTLIYRSAKGTFHEVMGVFDFNYEPQRGWEDLYAIQTNVQGRLRQIFLSPEEVLTETIYPPALNDT
jgi:hypothetical protein